MNAPQTLKHTINSSFYSKAKAKCELLIVRSHFVLHIVSFYYLSSRNQFRTLTSNSKKKLFKLFK